MSTKRKWTGLPPWKPTPVRFSMECVLRVEQLETLSPEQARAVLVGIGQVIAASNGPPAVSS